MKRLGPRSNEDLDSLQHALAMPRRSLLTSKNSPSAIASHLNAVGAMIQRLQKESLNQSAQGMPTSWFIGLSASRCAAPARVIK